MSRKKTEHQIINGVELKRCYKCKEWLLLEQFYYDKSRADGFSSLCRSCNAAKSRAWKEANREEGLAYGRAYSKTWRDTHPERVRALAARRRAHKRNAPGYDYTTTELIKARWDYYGGLCWLCGAPATATDHVKPLAKGGAHWPCNLRPACRSCNSAKKDHWPFSKADLTSY